MQLEDLIHQYFLDLKEELELDYEAYIFTENSPLNLKPWRGVWVSNNSSLKLCVWSNAGQVWYKIILDGKRFKDTIRYRQLGLIHQPNVFQNIRKVFDLYINLSKMTPEQVWELKNHWIGFKIKFRWELDE